MKSFFTRFKNKFETDFGGRYLAIVLREVIIDDHKILKILFPKLDLKIIKGENLEEIIRIEYQFNSAIRKKKRRADLAVIVNKNPLALLEIKYRDEKEDHNEAQLEDYIAYIKNKNISFTYLTQYLPPREHLKLLPKAEHIKHMLYSELYNKIEKRNNSVTYLFSKFLEETTGMYEGKMKEKEKQLHYFLNRAFNLERKGTGGALNTATNVDSASEILSILFTNLRLVGEHYWIHFNEIVNQHPRVDYYLNPYFNTSKLKKFVSKLPPKTKAYIDIPAANIDFGDLAVYCSSKIPVNKPQKNLYLYFGNSFFIEKNEISFDFWVEIWANSKTKIYKSSNDYSLKKYPKDEMHFFKKIAPIIQTTCQLFLKKKIPSYYRNSIKDIKSIIANIN